MPPTAAAKLILTEVARSKDIERAIVTQSHSESLRVTDGHSESLGVTYPDPAGERERSGEEKRREEKKKKETRLAPLPISKEVIGYLNEQAGSSQKPTAKAHRKLIQQRLDDGATVDDLKTVIRKKCAEWKGTHLAGNLKPSCLFRACNFDGYLGQPETGRQGQASFTDADWMEGCDNAPGKGIESV